MMVNLLVIRDPDYANAYVADGPINEITIDLGGQWNGYSDFAQELAEGNLGALDYEEGLLGEVGHLAEDNPVRAAVEEFFATAREDGAV